jgi:hypothetical protein
LAYLDYDGITAGKRTERALIDQFRCAHPQDANELKHWSRALHQMALPPLRVPGTGQQPHEFPRGLRTGMDRVPPSARLEAPVAAMHLGRGRAGGVKMLGRAAVRLPSINLAEPSWAVSVSAGITRHQESSFST